MRFEERLHRPQILSTSRHISQGGVDLKNVGWDVSGLALKGASNVVKGDPYSIYVRLPAGYRVTSASFGGHGAEIRVEERMAEIKFVSLSGRGPLIGLSASANRHCSQIAFL